MSYLNILPDELYHKIMKIVMADILWTVKCIAACKSERYHLQFMPENNDPIRLKYLQQKFIMMEKRGKGKRKEVDYFKLIVDLERPVTWYSIHYGWKLWHIRKYTVVDMGQRQSGILWHSTYEPALCSQKSYHRLINTYESSTI